MCIIEKFTLNSRGGGSPDCLTVGHHIYVHIVRLSRDPVFRYPSIKMIIATKNCNILVSELFFVTSRKNGIHSSSLVEKKPA
jgi:hypothetical protein